MCRCYQELGGEFDEVLTVTCDECLEEAELESREAPEIEWLSDCCGRPAFEESLQVTPFGVIGVCSCCSDNCSFHADETGIWERALEAV